MNLILLVLTIGTTLLAGASNWAGYANIGTFTGEAFLLGGLSFTLPLLLILGIHELGHYVVAKRYKVNASLPFFIPAPFLPLGTFGAVISMRDPMPSRKALIDIGAAGPVLGLITAIPITILGMLLWGATPHPASANSGGTLLIDLPPLYRVLSYFIPIPQDTVIHPTAFAGWVGLFVTALNLLPAGQLDGGHVARAVLGENGKFVSYGALLLMLGLSLFYQGWLIIAIFILLLGARHPPPLNDLTKLDAKRYGLASAAAIVLVLSFVAVPFTIVEPRTAVQFEAPGAPGVGATAINATVAANGTTTSTFRIVNGGNVNTTVTLTLSLPNFPANLTVAFANVSVGNRSIPVTPASANFSFDAGEAANVTISINATAYRPGLTDFVFSVKASVTSEALARPVAAELRVNLHVA